MQNATTNYLHPVENGPATASQVPRRVGSVEQTCAMIESQLDQLAAGLEILRDRIGPVLSRVSQVSAVQRTENTCSEQNQPCDLAHQLECKADRIEQMAQHVASLIERIEL